MISHILCYGSQIWGYEFCQTIESIQNMFCKRYINVCRNTNTCIALGECGRLPLCITYYTNCVRYWCNLLQMSPNRYPRKCYLLLKSLDESGRSCWAIKVKDLLYMYGFGYVWISQDVGDKKLFISKFKQRLTDCFTQDWQRAVNDSSRCTYYKHYKSLLDPEKYLFLNIPKKFKISHAIFRCSNHKLMVDVGRYSNIAIENRICQICSVNNNISIDCEYHAVFFIVENILTSETLTYIPGTLLMPLFVIFIH